jgi:hypothetical protein
MAAAFHSPLYLALPIAFLCMLQTPAIGSAQQAGIRCGRDEGDPCLRHSGNDGSVHTAVTFY